MDTQAPELPGGSFGARLARWRTARRASQLSLASDAGISQRHLSFLESGRARPSRAMVIRLCETLEAPLRARNDLLAAAGYAPLYPERALGTPDMAAVREALARIPTHHEPYPAFAFDRAWNVALANESAMRLVGRCVSGKTLAALSPAGVLNFMRLMFEPTQMRPRIRNWDRIQRALSARLRREAAVDPWSPSSALAAQLAPAHAPADLASRSRLRSRLSSPWTMVRSGSSPRSRPSAPPRTSRCRSSGLISRFPPTTTARPTCAQ